jgi:hypothetical protein
LSYIKLDKTIFEKFYDSKTQKALQIFIKII